MADAANGSVALQTAETGRPAWHAFDASEALVRLDTSSDGLTEDEARRRLETHGPNRLPQAEAESWFSRLLRQFHDVLIYILIAAAMITALLGEWIDMGVILGVVVINALIGFIQEGKAEAALESIRSMLSLHAAVIRGGRRRDIEAEELVPGDVVFIESGDRIPADLRVLKARNLQVEEAALTGESQPVTKSPEPADEGAPLGDRTSMLFSGTTVTRGQGRGVVIATGSDTEIGQIGEMISTVETLTTPLIRAINRFGKTLSLVILLIAVLAFAFGYLFRDFALEELFLIIVGLAVAAIPEGLPAIMTITLALGVQRMARRNAILRRLPAVETLGSVTVICSDKTGTLTRNEMTVARILHGDDVYTVEGSGYEPAGDVLLSGEKPPEERRDRLAEFARSAVLSSDAVLRETDGAWQIDGDPTEGALIVLGEKMGLPQDDLNDAHERLDTIPFESENQYMATLTAGEGDANTIHVKGSPERVIAMCRRHRGVDGDADLVRERWEERIAAVAAEGHRMIAVAKRDGYAGSAIDPSDLRDLTLLGVVGIIDPPRAEAITAVQECREAGIRVVMITGDHALTARAIGAQLGIGDGTEAVTGTELDAMSDEDLLQAAMKHDVFARTSPEHKLRLVEALQSQRHVVAMTGDGVNDAPALKRADVGVAMGIKGAEASKDASDMVLADDNFATIARAVREGRTIYDNLKKTILFILPTNGAEALLVLATLVFAFAQLPITPLQILWVNMVTAVTLALALAFEPSEPGVMRRPPRAPDEPILSGYLVWRIAFVSVLIGAAALALFFMELDRGSEVALAQTVAVNVLVVGQFFYLFNSRFIRSSTLSWKGIVGNPYALVAGAVLFVLQAGFTYLPLFNLWFGTEAMPVERWLLINTAGLAVFLIVEAEKAFFRLRDRGRAVPA
jgi:magnesium-transporting ATPase (P-type)